jgi:hypothetical protein
MRIKGLRALVFRMVSKRRLGASMIFLALHTGLLTVAIGTIVGSLLCLVAVNVPAYLD